MSKAMQAERKMWSKHYTYDEWMEAQRDSHLSRLLHRGLENVTAGLVGRTSVQLRRLSSWWAKRVSPPRG